MKKILVPTDFSEISKNALRFAIEIAYPLKAKIILLHTVHPIFADGNSVETYPDEFDADLKMSELLDYISYHQVSCDKIVRTGLLGDVITNITDEKKPDLIITGMHTTSPFDGHILFGTNSMAIFDRVTCPVIIVPFEAKYKGIKKIMYATDFQFGDLEELNKVCLLAQIIGASVLVVHISTKPKNIAEKEEDTMDWFADMESERINYDKISYRVIYHNDVTEGLKQMISSAEVDMICMSTIEKSFFKKIFTKSNIEKMAYDINIPLLAVHLTAKNKISGKATH